MSMALCKVCDALVDTDEDVDCYEDEIYPGECVCRNCRIDREPLERIHDYPNPRL